jgi:DNA repair protein RecO
MVFGREPGREVFRLVEEALGLLDGGVECDPVLRAFELHLLAVTGYAPVLDRCRQCGRPAEVPTLFLAAERGGFLCRGCVRPGERVRPVAATTVRELMRLAGGPLATAATGVSPATLTEAAVVAELLIGSVSAGPLRTRAFTEALRRRI